LSIPVDGAGPAPTATGAPPGVDPAGESPAVGAPPATAPAPPPDVTSLPALAGVPTARAGSHLVLHPGRDRYVEVAEALADAGFEMCADLCAVDYLSHMGRFLPEGVEPERFEIVVSLLSIARRERVRIRVQVPESDPTVGTLFFVYPGVDAMEREAYDMFGVRFDKHPDLTRILLPEDWEGHPLRKDYSVGRVPVQFKEAPGPR
jgi:NADH-quinone oxidoreductase subunit C